MLCFTTFLELLFSVVAYEIYENLKNYLGIEKILKYTVSKSLNCYQLSGKQFGSTQINFHFRGESTVNSALLGSLSTPKLKVRMITVMIVKWN